MYNRFTITLAGTGCTFQPSAGGGIFQSVGIKQVSSFASLMILLLKF